MSSLAVLTGAVAFLSSGMDDPQPADSTAAMFSAFLHFCSTNFSTANSTKPWIQLGLVWLTAASSGQHPAHNDDMGLIINEHPKKADALGPYDGPQE